MEMLEIVCENTNMPTGECLPRGEAIVTGAWCRSTNVFVLNSEGQVLCHQRSLNKERLPGAWFTHLGGHVSVGETYEENAHKEMEEESGVRPMSALLPWRTTRIPRARLWVREYVTLADLPIEAFTPQPGEVQRFAWMSPEEIAAAGITNPGEWCAGTHDFTVEYQCMRAALTAATSYGAVSTDRDLSLWLPRVAAA